jgi:hypothetical protein
MALGVAMPMGPSMMNAGCRPADPSVAAEDDRGGAEPWKRAAFAGDEASAAGASASARGIRLDRLELEGRRRRRDGEGNLRVALDAVMRAAASAIEISCAALLICCLCEILDEPGHGGRAPSSRRRHDDQQLGQTEAGLRGVRPVARVAPLLTDAGA